MIATKEVIIDNCDRVILIRINRRYYENISEQELYEATRGIWKVAPSRANKVDYAFSLFQGIVKEVYEVDRWHQAGTLEYFYTDTSSFIDSGRWEFEGKKAKDNIRSKYVGKSLQNYFNPGNQNPIKYVNC